MRNNYGSSRYADTHDRMQCGSEKHVLMPISVEEEREAPAVWVIQTEARIC